ncbi:unnamed protein product [Ophioblennius macclurei]
MSEEDEVNYASVVFKNKNNKNKTAVKSEEQPVYDEVMVRSQTTAQTSDDKNLRHKFHLLACFFGNLCLLLLVVVIGMVVYVSSLKEQNDRMQANHTSLRAVNDNLTALQLNLTSDLENLRSNNTDLARAYAVLERNVSKMSADLQNVSSDVMQLRRENQDLEAQRRNLTEKLQEVEKASNELNVSRAQWAVDQYCCGQGRRCEPCQRGWIHRQSQCYEVNDPPTKNRKTWEEAREDCRRKMSDLVVINDDAERWKVSDLSRNSQDQNGYWIGLRAMNRTWKWVDGTEPSPRSVDADPVEGQCVISVQPRKWQIVSCDRKMRWICEKKSLSL